MKFLNGDCRAVREAFAEEDQFGVERVTICVLSELVGRQWNSTDVHLVPPNYSLY